MHTMRLALAPGLLAAALLAGCAGGPFATNAPPRSDQVFSRILPGASEDDVQRLIGAPDEVMGFPATRTHAWSYVYTDTWGFPSEYSVTFDAAGRAVSTFSRRIGYGGGDQGK